MDGIINRSRMPGSRYYTDLLQKAVNTYLGRYIRSCRAARESGSRLAMCNFPSHQQQAPSFLPTSDDTRLPVDPPLAPTKDTENLFTFVSVHFLFIISNPFPLQSSLQSFPISSPSWHLTVASFVCAAISETSSTLTATRH